MTNGPIGNNSPKDGSHLLKVSSWMKRKLSGNFPQCGPELSAVPSLRLPMYGSFNCDLAVTSGLHDQKPILISRKDKATFEKLDFLTSKEENYNRMREYIRSLKMNPCIPYLDMKQTVQYVIATCLRSRHIV
ncbi:Ras-specific guanine nucleotide-releasing factor [Triplophysa tibetana]|uniref:Ras-specific guanine nucleotide-releasing factor n=1 Tax=Triplophysa tibetana TaxID=1572043 RepID=A0A5A9NXM7_9TELE|nr:Ras-specific guanine nucleotide-releasing factor [Triplophysa tibetana]